MWRNRHWYVCCPCQWEGKNSLRQHRRFSQIPNPASFGQPCKKIFNHNFGSRHTYKLHKLYTHQVSSSLQTARLCVRFASSQLRMIKFSALISQQSSSYSFTQKMWNLPLSMLTLFSATKTRLPRMPNYTTSTQRTEWEQPSTLLVVKKWTKRDKEFQSSLSAASQ